MPLSASQMVDLYFNGQASDAKFQGDDLLVLGWFGWFGNFGRNDAKAEIADCFETAINVSTSDRKNERIRLGLNQNI